MTFSAEFYMNSTHPSIDRHSSLNFILNDHPVIFLCSERPIFPLSIMLKCLKMHVKYYDFFEEPCKLLAVMVDVLQRLGNRI